MAYSCGEAYKIADKRRTGPHSRMPLSLKYTHSCTVLFKNRIIVCTYGYTSLLKILYDGDIIAGPD